MIRFFSPDIKTTLSLSEDDSKHCARVLRHLEGDSVQVVDGMGTCYECVITDANPRAVRVNIVSSKEEKKPWKNKITIAVAPTKNPDRMEWMVEKMTEIGVDEIVMMRCDHSERKEIKTSRLEKILISAMKQSLKATLPRMTVNEPFKNIIESSKDYAQKFIAYCDDSILKSHLCNELKSAGDVIVLIGPEGDFSPAEVDIALANGFKPVSLGECRLRTETAAISALNAIHCCQVFNNDK